jgi:hypothetical protein
MRILIDTNILGRLAQPRKRYPEIEILDPRQIAKP